MTATDRLWALICQMHQEDWPHYKRGRILQKVTVADAAKHLGEESLELLEAFSLSQEAHTREELCDIYGIVIHAALMLGMTQECLATQTHANLLAKFKNPNATENTDAAHDEPGRDESGQ